MMLFIKVKMSLKDNVIQKHYVKGSLSDKWKDTMHQAAEEFNIELFQFFKVYLKK